MICVLYTEFSKEALWVGPDRAEETLHSYASERPPPPPQQNLTVQNVEGQADMLAPDRTQGHGPSNQHVVLGRVWRCPWWGCFQSRSHGFHFAPGDIRRDHLLAKICVLGLWRTDLGTVCPRVGITSLGLPGLCQARCPVAECCTVDFKVLRTAQDFPQRQFAGSLGEMWSKAGSCEQST
jgi:hypothetical protein